MQASKAVPRGSQPLGLCDRSGYIRHVRIIIVMYLKHIISCILSQPLGLCDRCGYTRYKYIRYRSDAETCGYTRYRYIRYRDIPQTHTTDTAVTSDTNARLLACMIDVTAASLVCVCDNVYLMYAPLDMHDRCAADRAQILDMHDRCVADRAQIRRRDRRAGDTAHTSSVAAGLYRRMPNPRCQAAPSPLAARLLPIC